MRDPDLCLGAVYIDDGVTAPLAEVTDVPGAAGLRMGRTVTVPHTTSAPSVLPAAEAAAVSGGVALNPNRSRYCCLPLRPALIDFCGELGMGLRKTEL